MTYANRYCRPPFSRNKVHPQQNKKIQRKKKQQRPQAQILVKITFFGSKTELNSVINIALVRLSPRQWPKAGQGAAKQQIKKSLKTVNNITIKSILLYINHEKVLLEHFEKKGEVNFRILVENKNNASTNTFKGGPKGEMRSKFCIKIGGRGES